MRNISKKVAIGIIIAVVVIFWMASRLVTSIGNGIGDLFDNPDKYKYGIPMQHVVELHYQEIGQGLMAEYGYPVYETSKNGWVVYTVKDDSGQTLKEIVFDGPDFWDDVKKGVFEDTNNW